MFDIGWGELLVIGIVALIVIGPKELPGALRTLGHWMGKVRRMAGDFQDQFREAMREAELADLKKEVDDMAAKASSYAAFDPIAEARQELEKAAGDLPGLETPSTSTTAAPVASTPSAEAPASADAAPPPAESAPAGEPHTPSVETETVAAEGSKPDSGRTSP